MLWVFPFLWDHPEVGPSVLWGEAADLSSPPLPQYMGCVEVLQSMRALDFNTRTQVTRLVGIR